MPRKTIRPEAYKAPTGPIPSLPPHRREIGPYHLREVACLTKPALHAEGEHVLNFTTDTVAMLDSTGDHLTIRERRFLVSLLSTSPRPSVFRPGSKVLSMTDRQWATWERLRGVHLIHMRRGSKAPAGFLSIALPEPAL